MTKSQVPSLTPEITEAFAPQVIEVMRNSVAPTANDQEFLLFAHKAASYGLDPFKNEIFFIKYGQTARIQFAAEAYLSKAREKEGFQPPNTQMVHENDEFQIGMNEETKEMEVKQHDIGFPRGKIIGAYSVAYRDNHRPVTVIMDIEEVQHMFTGQNKDNWKKWTQDMFGKHVQQRALKKQYGLEFDDETISHEENKAPDKPRERKDITPNQEQVEQPKEEQVTQTDDQTNDLRNEINQKFSQLGIKTKEQVKEYLKNYAPNINPATANAAEMSGLIELMDMHIEEEMAKAQERATEDDEFL